MRTPVLAMTLLVASTSMIGTTRADVTNTASASSNGPATVMDMYAESFVSIARRSTGEPILVVNYPWRKHARASIEIRQLASGEVDDGTVKSLLFRHELMKGAALVGISRCLDRCRDGQARAEFTQREIDFEVLGDRNSFGSPSVCVACRTKYKATGGKTVSRAVFPLLEPWAVDNRKLYLDLPSDYFPQECMVRVWMLRGHDVIWTTTVRWPGDPQEQGLLIME
jgi:hypothetical protein